MSHHISEAMYNCFHSTKEGFKAGQHQHQCIGLESFHSTKEGFKGCSPSQGRTGPARVSIPPRKVSRDSCATAFLWSASVSIPPRKVSRRAVHLDAVEEDLFPFHQGRFQGAKSKAVRAKTKRSFHSTKEGFKVLKVRLCGLKQREVSIPPRKVSRGEGLVSGLPIRFKFPFHQGRFQG